VYSRAQLVGGQGHEVRRPIQVCLLKEASGETEEECPHEGSWQTRAAGRLPLMHRAANVSTAEGAPISRREAATELKKSSTEVSPEKLLDDVRRAMIDDPASARSAALRLLMLLSASPAAGRTIVRGGLAPWQLRKIDRYLRENLARPLQLPALAEQINLSVSHFNRSFKVSRGVTPHQYIVKLRLELAQSLMLTTDDPLCSIALTCGLADQAHLTKLFRRHFGETPAAWRRQRFDEDAPRATDGRNVADRLTRRALRTANDPMQAA
jgi:AraC family transcriptional regulator